MDVQITVASKVPNIPGKPTSKVIDTTGKTWIVFNDKFAQFQEGNSYNITKYKINDFKGTSYYMVEAFTTAIAGARVTTNGGAPQAVPPRFQSSADNSKIDEQRRMDIFICGAFNNMMANPNVHPIELDASYLTALVNILRQVWLTTLGPNRPSPISTSPARMDPPARSADLDDQIPF